MSIKRKSRKEAFTSIYDEGYWGSDDISETGPGSTGSSGAGSSLEATKSARQIIVNIIKEYKINSIVDVACGNFKWMPLVLSELPDSVKYTGCDIVDSLITQHAKNYPQYTFTNLDFVEETIPEGELIICREALQHLPVKDINNALRNFSGSNSRYLLATTHIRRFGFQNKRNIRPGRCRDRNLLVQPFSLPNPIVIYSEQYKDQDKFLGLWDLPF